MSNHAPLLEAWVERIFSRFSAVWGVQKVGAMFPSETHAEVRAVWAEQLGRFSGETLRAGIQASVDSGREWPPTLAEFVETCRHASIARVQHAPATMLPRPAPNPEIATAAIAQAAASVTSAKPGKEWARRLIARHEAGEKLSLMQLTMAAAAVAELAGQ